MRFPWATYLIITACNEEIAEKAKELVRKYIDERGLKLSEEKTIITNIDEGFDFLGWNVRKYKGKLLVKPSKKSIQKIIKKIRDIIHKNVGSKQDYLIDQLNPIITGWSNYHQCAVARKTFEKIDHIIFQMLWKWSKRRHPNKNKHWIKQRYWKTEENRHWVFRDIKTLKKMSDKKIVRHLPLKLDRNPYIDKEYFAKRKMNLEANKMSGQFKTIWRKQKGLCPQCGKLMEVYKERTLIYVTDIEANKPEEMKYIHISCISAYEFNNAGRLKTRNLFIEA